MLPRPIEFGPTRRGALVGEFVDRFGAQCSLQESSYEEETCLWLGIEVDSMGEPLPSARMHLTRDLARELAEALLYFSAEGSLGAYDVGDYRVGGWVVGVGRDNRGVLGRIVEVHASVHISVQGATDADEVWYCSWALVPSTWVPTESPRRASLFEHLEGVEV